jgi:ribosomal protein S17E
MSIIVVNPEGFKELSKYSGNPFLDAMVDLQGVFTILSAYQQAKPYIDRYSDTSLSDLKDKIKAYLPEAVNEDGSINFAKIEELASQGNKIAEAVLGIKQQREQFANTSISNKLATFKDKGLVDILSGNLLTKQATVLKRMQEVEDLIKKSNIRDDIKTLLLLNKEKIAENPEFLSAILPFFTFLQDQAQAQNQTNTTQEDNLFSVPANQSIQSIFDEKANNILQSLIPNTNQTTIPSLTSEKKKQVVNKLKQYISKKKSKKQQQQKTNQQQQQSLNSGIIFPWQNTSLPILPYENLLPKITTLW